MSSESVKCSRCGFENLPNAVFCSGCGARLKPISLEAGRRLEALYLLLLVGSAYLLVSLAVNMILKTIFFAILYLVSALSGLYASYRLYRNRTGYSTLAISAMAAGVGFGATIIIFYLGLRIGGVFGPGWVIFLVASWKIWKDRSVIAG